MSGPELDSEIRKLSLEHMFRHSGNIVTGSIAFAIKGPQIGQGLKERGMHPSSKTEKSAAALLLEAFSDP